MRTRIAILLAVVSLGFIGAGAALAGAKPVTGSGWSWGSGKGDE